MLFIVIIASIVHICLGHMSMQFPSTRDRDVNGNIYAKWQSNEPMVPARPEICHGLPSESTVRPENRFVAGDIVTVDIYGTASHYGGHCSFWYSLDDMNFIKIADVKDCTLNPQSTQVQIPDTLPIECGTKCTFAWSWIPTVSGQCEVYSNCADISVSGLSGNTESEPQEINFQSIIDDNLCQRVDESTHWSNTFEPLKLQGPFPANSTFVTGPPTTSTSTTSTTLNPVTSNTSISTTTSSTANSSENIKVENYGTLGVWWFAAQIRDIAVGVSVNTVELGSNGVWSVCEEDSSSGSVVYQIAPSTALVLPLSLKITASNGAIIEALDVITDFNEGSVFDIGTNFGSSSSSTTSAPTSTTSSSSTSTSSTSSTTSTSTSTSTTSSTSPSQPGNENGITVQNTGSIGQWWYAATVGNVVDGIYIEMVEVRSKDGEYTDFCNEDTSYGEQIVYQCDPGSNPFVYPLSIRILGSNGQFIEAVDAIKNSDDAAIFDLGVNFGATASSTTSTTSSTSTSTTTSTANPTTSTSSSTTSTSTTTSTAKPTSTTSSTSTSSTTSTSTSTSTTSSTTSSSTTTKPTTTSSTSSTSTTESTTSTLSSTENSVSSSTTSSTMATSVSPTSSTSTKEIIGYYPSWQWYDRSGLAKPQNLDFSKLTIVNFAFFQTDLEGNIYGTDSWADPNVLYGPYDWSTTDETASNHKCHFSAPNKKDCANHKLEEGLIGLVHKAGKKIFPSIGGWTLSDNFPTVAANAVTRSNFAKQCVELIKEYDFDGIDIDWEYPGYAPHSGTPQDTLNFNLLLNEIRSELNAYGEITGKYYELTAALPCGPTIIDNIDIQTITQVLDQLNLMTYDFFGSWSQKVGINAPLYNPGNVGEEFKDFNVDSCVKNWRNGGATNDKINIGLPFYGRSFKDAKGLNENFDGADTMNWAEDEGVPQYFNIEKRLNEMTSVRDEVSKTQYAYFADGGIVSYDDPQAISDKVEYALNNDLNGFIIWEITGDVREDLSTPLLDEVNHKINTWNNAGFEFEPNDVQNAASNPWFVTVVILVVVIVVIVAFVFWGLYIREKRNNKKLRQKMEEQQLEKIEVELPAQRKIQDNTSCTISISESGI